MAEQVCPPMKTGSVDFNALHDAARKNKPLDEALDAATTTVGAASGDESEQPLRTESGFALRATGGGWFEVTGPGLIEPIKKQGEAQASNAFDDAVAAHHDDADADADDAE